MSLSRLLQTVFHSSLSRLAFSHKDPKKEAREEEREQLKPAIMNEEEGYYKLFSISVNGNHTLLLDSVADNPQIGELSLRDSAGVDTKIKTVNLHDKIFKLQFVDFSNQEQFKFLPGKFKRPYAGIMLSFQTAKTWLEANAIPGNDMLLVGNDHNLPDNNANKVVKTDTGKELARRFRAYFTETSTENPANLEQALTDMTGRIESSKIYKTGAIKIEG